MLKKIVRKIRRIIKENKAEKIKTDDKNLEEYFKIQIKQSFSKVEKDAEFRYKKMISQLLPFIDKNERKNQSVLCVGCRNIFELDEFENVGFGSVLGIDLFSVDNRIKIMDMHNISFEKDSFDVIYSADSLEHAHNPKLAVNNIRKVLKNKGYFCFTVPIQWLKAQNRVGEDLSKIADCQDFQSKEEVYDFFGENNKDYKIEYEEIGLGESGEKSLFAIIQIFHL